MKLCLILKGQKRKRLQRRWSISELKIRKVPLRFTAKLIFHNGSCLSSKRLPCRRLKAAALNCFLKNSAAMLRRNLPQNIMRNVSATEHMRFPVRKRRLNPFFAKVIAFFWRPTEREGCRNAGLKKQV